VPTQVAGDYHLVPGSYESVQAAGAQQRVLNRFDLTLLSDGRCHLTRDIATILDQVNPQHDDFDCRYELDGYGKPLPASPQFVGTTILREGIPWRRLDARVAPDRLAISYEFHGQVPLDNFSESFVVQKDTACAAQTCASLANCGHSVNAGCGVAL